MLTRRNFLSIAGASIPVVKSWVQPAAGAGMPVIKKITVFRSSGNFYRFIGMNAYDKAPKGINGVNPFIKIELSDGTTGIGPGGYAAPGEEILKEFRQFIGKDPFTFYTWDKDKITGVTPAMQPWFFTRKYAWFEAPLLDA